MKKFSCLIFFVLFVFAVYAEFKPQVKSLSSPDGKIKLEFSCSGCGIPYYKVSVDGKQFIDESELGISYNGSERTGHYIDKVSYRWDINEVWYQPLDENKENFSHFNEMTVVLQQDYLSYIKICFRVFNDGFAIKYEYDVKNAEKVILRDDCTMFAFIDDGMAWWIPADANTDEFEYKRTPINEVKRAAMPIAFKFDSGLYASVHEVALCGFPEMTLSRGENGVFLSVLSENTKISDSSKGMLPVKFSTSWRTVLIGRKAGDNYYLGASTDTTARRIGVPLSFLENDVEYEPTVYADGDNADTLDMRLASGGGQAVVFEKVKNGNK